MARVIGKTRLVASAALLVAAVGIVIIGFVLQPAPADAGQTATGSLSGRAGAIFAPGTDQVYVNQVIADSPIDGVRSGLDFARPADRWFNFETARGIGGNSPGDGIELTWSIIPDGTLMPKQDPDDTECNSNLIATFDSIYGAGNWQAEMQEVWDDWTDNVGNSYFPAVTPDGDGTPIDDGASWPNSPGLLNVRGDVRIGGCTIDGNSNILAFNYYPGGGGDMKLDAPDAFYASTSLDTGFHNVFSHEHGHGAGLAHVCPVEQTKLMEPFISTRFRGLQHDDLRGLHRTYGDRLELIGAPNDSAPDATPFTQTLSETGLSLDGTNDEDWFGFSATAGSRLDVSVAPDGLSYLEGPQNSNGSCTTGTTLNSATIQDLSFEVRNAAGSVLTTIDNGGAGTTETMSDFVIPAAGDYYVRVMGSGTDNAQLYDITASVAADVTPPVVQVVSPAEGATYERGQVVLADFTCTDPPGAGSVTDCTGDVASGQPLPDPWATGARSFDVTSSDVAGNTTPASIGFSVTDSAPPAGAGGLRVTSSATESPLCGGPVVTRVEFAGRPTLPDGRVCYELHNDSGSPVTVGSLASLRHGLLLVDDATTLPAGASTIVEVPVTFGPSVDDEVAWTAMATPTTPVVNRDVFTLEYRCKGMPVTINMNDNGGIGAGTATADSFLGTDQLDTISGLGGADRVCAMGGNDQILGGDGPDLIYGGAGNDAISAGAGDDNVWANEGNDQVLGDAGTDRLRGGDGDDVLSGGADRDIILGQGGEDTILGDGGRDSLYGGDDNDAIDGGADTDLVRGEDGDDRLFTGPSGNDRLVGGNGDDILDASGTAGSTRLLGDAGNDTFIGSNQLDRMWGHGGLDVMAGGGYNDIMRGGDDRDIMHGEAGRDTLEGGDGNDDLFGGEGNGDKLVGSGGTDLCDGGPGNFDFANATCETITGIP